MTVRKFKFWIQRIQNESSCRWKLSPSSSSSSSIARSEEERIVRTFLSILVTGNVVGWRRSLQGVQRGGRASDRCELCRGGLCKRGDGGGGSESRKGRKHRSEKRRRWCGGGWIEAGFLACHYHVRGFHPPLLPLLSYLSRAASTRG